MPSKGEPNPTKISQKNITKNGGKLHPRKGAASLYEPGWLRLRPQTPVARYMGIYISDMIRYKETYKNRHLTLTHTERLKATKKTAKYRI